MRAGQSAVLEIAVGGISLEDGSVMVAYVCWSVQRIQAQWHTCVQVCVDSRISIMMLGFGQCLMCAG